jgi:4,5-DOPA dioxygenase extradiol
MTHNLAMTGSTAAEPPAFAREFDAWVTERLNMGDVDGLVDWRRKAPAAFLAHPDDGAHYRVLLTAVGVCLGTSSSPRASFPVSGFEGALSTRCVELR